MKETAESPPKACRLLPEGILVGAFQFLDNLQIMSVKIDLHCHSFFSGDGVSSPEQLIQAARKKGLNAFVITDHNTCDAITYLLDKGIYAGRWPAGQAIF